MKMLFLLPLFLVWTGCSESSSKVAPAGEVSPENGIAQVDFESQGCYGTCPKFSLSIAGNGTARYDAGKYNEREGQFTATIPQPRLDSLFALVEAADVLHLQDQYTAPVTDVVAYTCKIRFQSGKSKTIRDEGPSGPEELKRLYTYLLSLKQTQQWK